MALGTWGWDKNDGKMMEKGSWKWWCLDLCLDLCSYVVLCSVVLDVALDVDVWCLAAAKPGKIEKIGISLGTLWQVGWILWPFWPWPYWWINASPRKVVA
jgi:hypothetical protein